MAKNYYRGTELAEFKSLIQTKLAKAREEYDMMKDTMSHSNSNGTDDTSWSFQMMEDGAAALSKEQTVVLAHNQEKFIKGLENALLRVGNGTYGECCKTGNKIPKERLMAVPHTTYSIAEKPQD